MYELILFNDSKNSIEDVMIGLTEILGHGNFQAEQCACITHHNGKCSIKIGKKQDMVKACYSLMQYGLNVKISKRQVIA